MEGLIDKIKFMANNNCEIKVSPLELQIIANIRSLFHGMIIVRKIKGKIMAIDSQKHQTIKEFLDENLQLNIK